MKTWLPLFVCLLFLTPNQVFSNGNTPPVITSVAPTGSIGYGQVFNYPITATDGESDPISFYTLGAEQLDANHQTGYDYATGYLPEIWQSFTALETGFLTKAGMQCAGNTSMGRQAFTIYTGTGTSGAVLYSDTLDFGAILDYHSISIPVSEGILMEVGQVYTLAVTNVTGYMILNLYSNPYPDGQSSWNVNTDFQFITRIQPLSSSTGYSWLTLTDNTDGTGTLEGTPTIADAGPFSLTLVALAAGQFSTQTVDLTIASPVPAPSDLQAVAGNGSVTLSWEAVTHPMAVRYLIYGGTTANPTSLIDSTGNLSDTTYTVTGLPNNELRYFRMKVRDDQGGLSVWSAQTYAVPVIEAGLAFYFDGSTSISFAPTVQNDFTIEFWMRSTQLGGGTGQWWMGRGLIDAESIVSPNDFGISLGAGRVVFGVGTGSVDTSIVSPYVANGEWHHVAATRSQSTGIFQLFVDGELVATGLGGTNKLNSPDQFRIGQINPNGNFFVGDMDDIRIWNVVRSENEIREYFGTRLTGKESGLINYITFDENVGQPVLDYSRNPSSLTVTGTYNKLTSYAMVPMLVRNKMLTVNEGNVSLSWSPNREGDVASYSVFRSSINNFYSASTQQTGINDTVFTEYIGTGDQLLYYWVKAIDIVGRESDFGNSVTVSTVDSSLNSVVTFDGIFPPIGWEIVNPDGFYTWSQYEFGQPGGQEEQLQSTDKNRRRGTGQSGDKSSPMTGIPGVNPDQVSLPNLSARVPFYDDPNIGQTDTLKTKVFLADANSWFKFDLAYRGYNGFYNDSLKILVLSSEGAETVFAKGTFSGLNSVRGQFLDEFEPVNDGEWREIGIDLTEWAGEYIRVAFVSVTGYGNYLYIDNVRVDSGLPAPQNLVTLGESGQVSLSWDPVVGSNFSHYIIYAGTSPELLEELGTTTTEAPADTNFVHSGLQNGDLWYYQVAAVNQQDSVGKRSVLKTGIPVTGAGQALRYDGVDDFVNLTNRLQLAGSSFTLEAWVKRYAITQNQLVFSVSNALEAGFSDSDEWITGFQENYLTSPESYPDTSWHHYAVTFDLNSSTRTLFVDGFAVSSDQTEGSFENDAEFILGSPVNGEVYFNGIMDEIRIWNVARTESEVLDNRDSYLLGNHPGLLAMYRFDESGGSILYDAVESNFHGIINGDAEFVPSGAFQLPTVPVELMSFAHVGNKLIWKTATETNNAGWEIERKKSDPSRTSGSGSQESEEWETIGFVAGAGTSTEERSYSFDLADVKETIRVRLRQLDTDGTVSYSQILTIESTPTRFDLAQNYPNPFNPSTVIRYQVSEISEVKLQVFDVTGRLVTTLVDSKKDLGVYDIEFNASGLSSGLYFYRISAGSFTAVKTMVLVK